MIKVRIEQKGMSERLHDVIVPVQKTIEMRKGQKITVDRKIFPGYILINLDLDDEIWHIIKNIPKVSGFLGGNPPKPVPYKEVEEMLKQVEEGEAPKDSVSEFCVGEIVKITSGPFETFSATIDDVDTDKKMLKVSVSIFGRATPMDLHYSQVEKID